MCIALPGKIIKIEGDLVTVDYEAEQRKAKIIEDDYEVGEYVFVQGGIVVQKIPKEEALKALEEWKKILENENKC